MRRSWTGCSNRASTQRKKEAAAGEYLYAILQANADSLREVLVMEGLTLEKVLEEFGLTSKWEAMGEAREKAQGIPRCLIS